MIIYKSLDIEDEIRKALKSYFSIYCRPLPDNFSTPSLLVSAVGGDDIEKSVDAFDVVLDSRAETEGEAMDLLLEATALLRAIAESQVTPLRYIDINSIVSWGNDPVRPDLAMCSARIKVYAHKVEKQFHRTLTITSTISGTKNISDVPNDFNISGYDGIVLKINDHAQRIQQGESGLIHTITTFVSGNTCTWTIDNVPEGEEITLAEANYDISGALHTGATTKTITIDSGENILAFVNVYSAILRIMISKVWSSGRTLPDNFQITNDLTDDIFTLENGTIMNNMCQWILNDIPEGAQVTFTESNFNIDGYRCITSKSSATTAESELTGETRWIKSIPVTRAITMSLNNQYFKTN